MSLLTKRQKKEICMLARRAWNALDIPQKRQYLNADGGQSDSAAFDLWRHAQQSVAVGRNSITASTNDEYCMLMAHFAMLAGETRNAAFWMARGASDERRRVCRLIRESCFGSVKWPSYPESICRAQFRCGLKDASTGQLYNILNTIRNRAAAFRRRSKQLTLGI